MKKIQIIYNAFKDIANILIKHKDANWELDGDWNRLIRDCERTISKYRNVGEQELELIQALVSAVYKYLKH